MSENAERFRTEMHAQFEANEGPFYQEVLILADAEEELGNDNRAMVLRWMVENEKWPEPQMTDGKIWGWQWYPDWSQDKGTRFHRCVLGEHFIAMDYPSNNKYVLFPWWKRAIQAIQVRFHLDEFERNSTPQFDKAGEVWDWGKIYCAKKWEYFLVGLGALIHNREWPHRDMIHTETKQLLWSSPRVPTYHDRFFSIVGHIGQSVIPSQPLALRS